MPTQFKGQEQDGCNLKTRQYCRIFEWLKQDDSHKWSGFSNGLFQFC
jgi:hypothetical protein